MKNGDIGAFIFSNGVGHKRARSCRVENVRLQDLTPICASVWRIIPVYTQ
jgi:hypothetical protein